MEWREIPGFPGYEASSTGLIKSKARVAFRLHLGTPTYQPIKERILSQWTRKYPNGNPICVMTGVSLNGVNSVERVHRLVLLAFVGPCPDGMVGCHSNGDPTNNRLENIRWDTEKSNCADAISHGTYRKPPIKRGNDNCKAKLNPELVREIRAVPNFRGITKELSRIYGVSPAVINKVRNGDLWSWVSD